MLRRLHTCMRTLRWPTTKRMALSEWLLVGSEVDPRKGERFLHDFTDLGPSFMRRLP